MNRYSISLIIFFSFIFLNANEKNVKDFIGFFNFSYDQSNDKIFLMVDKIDHEFLYVSSLATGVGSNDIGLDRGQLGSERLVKFIKRGNKLLLVQPNLYYRAETDNLSEKKSVDQAFAKSVLFGFKIIDKYEDSYKIDFTPFLKFDRHGVAKTLKNKNQGSYSVDLSKSSIEMFNTKAFPRNVEFEALLTFSGDAIGNLVRSVVPDPNNITLTQHHSFIQLPDNDYQPRKFDPRSGAIFIEFMDYSTPVDQEMVKKYIIRHRLKKKNPSLAVSEAVEPIIYYLDPGTPEPVKSALIDGASWWNEAYESIGFKNAFQVKVLPENIDPMDCRYNVIQWVHRSTRGWSYGASVVDPRTGEIIKGHVSLGSLRIRQDYMIAQALSKDPFKNKSNNEKMLDLALSRIRQLSAHEIGHTLGFAHNFAASTNNRSSVMDYPHPLIEIKDNEIYFNNAYDSGIGEWDKITVAYSYSELKGNQNEQMELNNILNNATAKGYRFISDYDARSLDGSHAFAHLWDNGDVAYDALDDVINIRRKAIQNFSEFNVPKGSPNSLLEDVFVPLYFFHRYQTEAAAKIIAGMDYNYSLTGSNQSQFSYLDKSTQLDALSSLMKTLEADFLAIPKDKLELFPPRAFGYPRTRESFKSNLGPAFDPFSASETSADMTLSLILRPKRLNRLIYQHALDNSNLSLNELYDYISEKTIFLNNSSNLSRDDSYLNEIQHIVNLTLLKRIFSVINDESSSFQVKSISNDFLNKLSMEFSSKKNRNLKLSKYSDYYLKMIRDFERNPKAYKSNIPLKIPDGSPIGMDNCNLHQLK
tara:strand:+ start:3340 stop:5772 length:2433 start_codon:yes stop_codon:yes gene_type:complete